MQFFLTRENAMHVPGRVSYPLRSINELKEKKNYDKKKETGLFQGVTGLAVFCGFAIFCAQYLVTEPAGKVILQGHWKVYFHFS